MSPRMMRETIEPPLGDAHARGRYSTRCKSRLGLTVSVLSLAVSSPLLFYFIYIYSVPHMATSYFSEQLCLVQQIYCDGVTLDVAEAAKGQGNPRSTPHPTLRLDHHHGKAASQHTGHTLVTYRADSGLITGQKVYVTLGDGGPPPTSEPGQNNVTSNSGQGSLLAAPSPPGHTMQRSNTSSGCQAEPCPNTTGGGGEGNSSALLNSSSAQAGGGCSCAGAVVSLAGRSADEHVAISDPWTFMLLLQYNDTVSAALYNLLLVKFQSGFCNYTKHRKMLHFETEVTIK